jgi:hypothetical protein
MKIFFSASVVYWSEFLATDPASRRYQIFWEVAGLEWGSPSLLSTIELLERKSSSSGLEIQEYGRVAHSIRKSWH